MACMLLRILRGTIRRLFFYAIIGLVSLSTSSFMFILLPQCQPVSAFWNPDTPNAKCLGSLPAQICLYFNAVVSIITDFTHGTAFRLHPQGELALTPTRRHRPAHVYGLSAIATVVVKTTLVKTYSTSGVDFYRIIDLYMWGFLEEEIGFTAVCILHLKGPFEKQRKFTPGEELNSNTADSRSGYLHFNKSQHLNHPLESMKRARLDVLTMMRAS